MDGLEIISLRVIELRILKKKREGDDSVQGGPDLV